MLNETVFTPNGAVPSFASLTGLAPIVTVIDVGANPIESDPSYSALLRSGRARVVGFEPNLFALGQLHGSAGPNETYLPHALGDGGQHRLHICRAPGMTSLFPPDPDVLGLFHGFPQWGEVIATELVQTVRLDDVLEAQGASFIKLDVQGAELMILRHATDRLSQALIVHCEVLFVAFYKEQPLFAEVESFLRSQGYMFHRFSPEVSRCFTPMLVGGIGHTGLSQLVWADAVFVRDFTRPERLSTDELIMAASLLHDCYGSFDASLRLLLLHDARAGGTLGRVYLDGLSSLSVAAGGRA